jgi:hypothetical protein
MFPALRAGSVHSKGLMMRSIQLFYYKGFSVQPLVYKYSAPSAKLSHDRTFDVSVRIGREGAALEGSALFKFPLNKPFSEFGEARRAAVEYAQQIIDGSVPDVSIEAALNSPAA